MSVDLGFYVSIKVKPEITDFWGVGWEQRKQIVNTSLTSMTFGW